MDSSLGLASHTFTIPIILRPEARRPMKYQIKPRKAFFSREPNLGGQLSLKRSIVEAKRRLDWKAATSAQGVDENGREVQISVSGLSQPASRLPR